MVDSSRPGENLGQSARRVRGGGAALTGLSTGVPFSRALTAPGYFIMTPLWGSGDQTHLVSLVGVLPGSAEIGKVTFILRKKSGLSL